MSLATAPPDSRALMGRYSAASFVAMVVAALAIVLAAFFIRISGAVQAPGVLQASAQNTIVQHPDGGLVTQILAREGDTVARGDVILRMDATELLAEQDRLMRRELELEVLQMRYSAALDGAGALVDSALRGRGAAGDAARDIFSVQSSALAAEAGLLRAEIAEARAEADGADAALEALRGQMATNRERVRLIESELPELEALVAEQLVPRSRLTRLQRERLDIRQSQQALDLERARLEAQASGARQRAQTVQKRFDDRAWRAQEDVATEVATVRTQLQQVAARLGRLDVTAPTHGRIHEIVAVNPGVVLAPGDAAFQIVPVGDIARVQTRIPAQDIEHVVPGQPARVRFDTLDQYRMPELRGEVVSVSPDRTTDPASGMVYFSASIQISAGEQARLESLGPATGMPVTVLIETRQRSLLSYFLAPVQSAFSRVFTEA